MNYVAGMDGGGTKTSVVIADEQGNVVYAFASGAINYSGQDESSIRRSFETMFETIDRVCGGLNNCVRLCIGTAGISNPAVVPQLTALVRDCGFGGGMTIVGDQEIALRGAHDGRSGIILIAGTGSICYGRGHAGETHRAGGCGHLLDDEGSGYSIGLEMLKAVAKANDGRLPPTVLTALVYERLQADSIGQLIAFAHDKRTNKGDMAALAPLLSDACDVLDAAALTIARKSAESLFELVVPVAGRLGLQRGNLALSGSVLLRNAHVRSELIRIVGEHYPEMSVYPAKREAAWGAVKIALEGDH
ncbi:MAG: ATPase [Cohnella sp.]|nr:ATPase [Cohnella sp.]